MLIGGAALFIAGCDVLQCPWIARPSGVSALSDHHHGIELEFGKLIAASFLYRH